MPFTETDGYRQHFTVDGSGPLVVLLHGLFLYAGTWRSAGVIEALSERFRVVAIDALGHGNSDRPRDPQAYELERQAAGIAEVLDTVGGDGAHFVGHSMGSWLAIGMARYCRARVASLAIGGWDPVLGSGALTPDGKPVPFEPLLAWARKVAPTMVAWVRTEDEFSLRVAWEATAAMDASAGSLLGSSAPKLLWCGEEDPYRPSMQAFASAHGLTLELASGDHVSAISEHGLRTSERICAFIQGVEDGRYRPIEP